MPATTANRPGFPAGRGGFRALGALVLAVSALLLSGCATAGADRNLLLFAETAPVPTIVNSGEELYAAQQAAKAQHGCFAVRGEGSSMEPIYVSGTAVVVRVGGYERLRRGMPVVYRTTRGVAVAHMLVEQTANGWVAAGLGNEGADVEFVTPNNLVGVITQAFAARTGSLPKPVAARIALRDQIRTSGKMASNQDTPNDLL